MSYTTISYIYSVYLQHRKISTDTRKIETGSLYFALKGEQFNGNTFASKALEAGAVLAVVDEEKYCVNDRCVLVDDVLSTLQTLSRYHRENMSIPVLAITGSNGKTTTKELVRDVLRKKYRTHATTGNLNNHIGVPLTILSMPLETEIAVIEMGANHQGEIALLSSLARPTHGIITNIGKAHLEGFGGVEGVKKGKGELYHFLQIHQGTAFVNSDSQELIQMSAPLKHKKFYSISGHSGIKSRIVSHESSLEIFFTSEEKEYLITSQLSGRYNAENILAAITIGSEFGIPARHIAEAISDYIPTNMRSQKIEKNTNVIFLDAYNANPSSMEAAIESFTQTGSGKKIAILGDMMELGEDSPKEHERILKLLESKAFDKNILIGANFTSVNKTTNNLCFNSIEEAGKWLHANKPSSSKLLVKGSRKMALEKILDYL